METGSFSGLLHNAILLLALGVIYDTLGLQNIRHRLSRDLLSGVLVGAIGIAVMSMPWELKPGIFFDTRWVLLSLCGLFFGPRPTLIAVAMTVSYRLYQGGGGAIVGSLVIISTSLVGLAWRHYSKRFNQPLNWWRLYLFGVIVELTMIACMFLMPEEVRWKIIVAVAPTTLIIFPIGSTLLGLILQRQNDRRIAEKALLESEKLLSRERGLLRGLIDAIPDLIFVKGTDSRYLDCNQAFEKFSGCTEADIQGCTDHELFGSRIAEFVRHKDSEVLASGEPIRYEVDSRYHDGREALLEVYKAPFYGLDGTLYGVMGISRDITDQRAADEMIWQQANFDALTGLPNRNMLRDRIGQELKRAHRNGEQMALMFVDLDRFKEVNDTLGHDTGDALLVEAAQRIAAQVRETDTVARLGGDEFTIILGEQHDTESVERIAQSVLDVLAEPFELGGEVAYVTGSIGITFYPDDGEQIDTLLKNADQAMYAAKAQGRNRYRYFTLAMQQNTIRRTQLAKDLREALALAQFELYYQPIVDLSSGQVVKAEALLRWTHPQRGMVNPMEFISVAEETGKITEIGNWVFMEAVRQVIRWRTSIAANFQVSVNVSPVQFREEECRPESWIGYLREVGLSGDAISVEITEGLLMESGEEVYQKLLAYRDANIQVSLDDFGTGYSSLAYLRRFDIDYLKIDKMFVSGLTLGSDDMALCEAIIVMAHKLGIKVVAEGIETREQWQLLVSVGCDYGQGYYFSRPLPAEQFEQLPLLKAPLCADEGLPD